MKTLLEDYKRRLKNVIKLSETIRSNGSILHQRREERLNTKAAEYRTFIVEIERVITNQRMNLANEFIIDIAKLLKMDTDGIGYDELSFSIDDFKEAINKLKR